MVEDHQITVVVEPDLLRSGRYRWTLLRSGQAQDRSEMSFATKREADADAEKALNGGSPPGRPPDEGSRTPALPATLLRGSAPALSRQVDQH
jgi:hypothetical protein